MLRTVSGFDLATPRLTHCTQGMKFCFSVSTASPSKSIFQLSLDSHVLTFAVTLKTTLHVFDRHENGEQYTNLPFNIVASIIKNFIF